jgi:hypothetical protein
MDLLNSKVKNRISLGNAYLELAVGNMLVVFAGKGVLYRMGQRSPLVRELL